MMKLEVMATTITTTIAMMTINNISMGNNNKNINA
jgi:hypothetical protein